MQLLKDHFTDILYTVGVIAGWWKFTDALFKYLVTRQREALEKIVDERIASKVRYVMDDIKVLRQERGVDHDILVRIASKMDINV